MTKSNAEHPGKRDIKAIETVYKGYRFRSRLEARWAVFFDSLGVRWEYEPEGFSLPSGPYLPDFLLTYPRNDEHGDIPIWAEVKPLGATLSALPLLKELSFATGQDVVLLAGTPGDRWAYFYIDYGCECSTLDLVLWSKNSRPWYNPGGCEREMICGDAWYQAAVTAARSARFGVGGRG